MRELPGVLMPPEDSARSFHQTICAGIRVVPEGTDRYRISSPFVFCDGDHLVLILKREKGEWILSDEGHTLMHLSYRLKSGDLMEGNRNDAIGNLCSLYRIENRGGELITPISDGDYGDAFFQMVQGLLRLELFARNEMNHGLTGSDITVNRGIGGTS